MTVDQQGDLSRHLIGFVNRLPDDEACDLVGRLLFYEAQRFSWPNSKSDASRIFAGMLQAPDELDRPLARVGTLIGIIAKIDHIYACLTSPRAAQKQERYVKFLRANKDALSHKMAEEMSRWRDERTTGLAMATVEWQALRSGALDPESLAEFEDQCVSARMDQLPAKLL